MGDPADGRLQHCNFRTWWDGIDKERAANEGPSNEKLLALLHAAHAEGRITPPDHLFQPQAATFPFNPRISQLQLNSWELEKIDPLDAAMVSRALMQCHVASVQLVRFVRAHLPGYENACIRKFPSFLGIRESRRIMGKYMLTGDDVTAGRKFDDGIARGWFWMDLHDSPPGLSLPHPTEHVWARRPARGDWFEVPYRCLVPEQVGGLLVAGRCISTDRDAHGAARVMATCMFMGSAAGIAAAWAAQRKVEVDAIDGREVRRHVIPHDDAQHTLHIGG